MAGSVRFVFLTGGPLDMFRTHDEAACRVPAAPLLVALRDPRIIIFLVAWFGLNLLFGVWVPTTGAMTAKNGRRKGGDELPESFATASDQMAPFSQSLRDSENEGRGRGRDSHGPRFFVRPASKTCPR